MLRSLSGSTALLQACNTTSYYYRANNSLPSLARILNRRDLHDGLLSPICRTTIQVCLLYYCRIQELLNATVADVIEPDRVLIRGLKKSLDYIIFLPGLSHQIEQWKNKKNFTKLFPVTYMKLYRSILVANLGSQKIKKKNTKRLHQARYDLVADLIGRTGETNISAILRHRSRSSLQYYIK